MFVRIIRRLIEHNRRASFAFFTDYFRLIFILYILVLQRLSSRRNQVNIFFDSIMPKRKTRSVNIDVDETAAREIGLPKRKKFRNKNSYVTKLSFDEPDLLKNHGNRNSFSPEAIISLSVDDPTPIAPKTPTFDQQRDPNDRENSPPPLVIDTDKEVCSGQSIMSDYFPSIEPLGERLPRAPSNAVEKTRSNTLNEPTFVMSDRNHCHAVGSANNERSRENSL